MPLLDVSDVLDDVDFADVFSVVRPAVVPSEAGVPVETDRTFTSVSGVVVSTGAADLQLLPEGTFQKGSIQIYTRFPLQAGAGGAYEADVVNWNGANWTVVAVEDWSRFGSGYMQATATLRDVNPPGEARNA